jgi:oligopeptide transport system permease protein
MMRFVDIMYGLPYMLIVIILMALFRKEGQDSVVILFIGIALVSWLTIARVVRGQIISLKNSEFVEAARSMGAGPGRIIFRHLLPNALGVIIVFTSLSLPSFIMSESFLSFLGMGVSAPLSSWGSLVSEGANTMELYPWQLLVPAIEMTLFLFCMNFLGDGLRDALDPQSKNRT